MENYAQYGVNAERVVFDYLKERLPLDIRHHLAGDKSVRKSIQGDISFDFGRNRLSINVVRGTWISHKSTEDFMGQFYCLFPEGDISAPSKGKVIMSKTVRSYKDTCKKNLRKEEVINKKPGFRYKNIQVSLTLEDFVTHLSKMIIAGYTCGAKEYYITLVEPFIKDYKNKKGYI